MTGVRDSQRQKVYDAEDRAFPIAKSHSQELSVPQMQALVDKWGQSKVLRRHYPLAAIQVRVTDGRGRRRASYFARRWRPDGTIGPTIAMPRWSRSVCWLLHEYAHHLTDDKHGPRFAMCYLYLVRVFMGVGSEARLRAEFKAGKVRHSPPRTRNMTDAQRAAARERMVALNARRASALDNPTPVGKV